MSALPKEAVDQIKAMRADNVPWKVIIETFGVSYETARSAIDPEYHAARAKRNAIRNRKEATGIIHDPSDRSNIKNCDIDKRRQWMARQDTRDLTAVMMGDPFPGRSALDRKTEGRAQS